MDTKENIMQVTFDLLLEKGFDAISVSQITKEAGITKGALYYFFDNKEDLFDQVVEHYIMDFMKGVLDSRISETSSIKEQVRLFYEIKTVEPRSSKEDPSGQLAHKNFYRLLQAGIDKYDRLRVQFEQFNEQAINYQVAVLEEGKRQGLIRKDLDSKMMSLNNMTWGRGMLHFDESNDIENKDEMADAYFDIIWRGISTEYN